jgi:hypothetical protein
MPATYEPIATTTTSGSATTVTFSSIAGTYTDLVVIGQGSASANTGVNLRLNGDTASNYSNTILFGDGSSAGSLRQTSVTSINFGFFGTGVSDLNGSVMNYSNTTTNKTTLSRRNSAAVATSAVVGLYRSTSAITSVTLFTDGAITFTNGTTFTLYGIKAA